MANKSVTPGTTGNLQTDLGGAPSAGDVFFINEGAVDYTTVPDWSATQINSVYIGEYFRGSIASSWILQASGVVDNGSSSPSIYVSAAGTTIAEVRHQPKTGGVLYVQGAGGTVTALHSWGPCVASVATLTNAYIKGGSCVIQSGNVISGEFIVSAGATCTLERDYAAATVSGTLILNSSSITPSGVTTVTAGGTLKVNKCGTWATTTADLVLEAGATLDLSAAVGPVTFEDFIHHAGAVIIQRKGPTIYSVAGTETAKGGGATTVYV